MAKYVGYKRPKDTKKTLKHLFAYLGMHKWAFLSVAVLVFISAGANIMGTYLIKPVVNKFITPGDMHGLFKAVAGMPRSSWRSAGHGAGYGTRQNSTMSPRRF